MANTERVKQAIAIMERAEKAGSLDMSDWQSPNLSTLYSSTYAMTEAALHSCGNTACFAGHVAISPEFKKAGGSADIYGSPIFQGRGGEHAIEKWLECSWEFADGLVLGGVTMDFYPVPFREVKPHHVIEKLNLLLTGEAE